MEVRLVTLTVYRMLKQASHLKETKLATQQKDLIIKYFLITPEQNNKLALISAMIIRSVL